MNKSIFKFFEYAYLVMFVLATIAVFTNWETDRNRAYLFLFFAVVAVFMFFFKRYFRKKIEKNRHNK